MRACCQVSLPTRMASSFVGGLFLVIPYIIPLGSTRYDGATERRTIRMPKGRRRELKVTVSFEPNRLEEQNITTAYELVLPIKQSMQRSRKKEGERKPPLSTQQLELFSKAAIQ